MKKTISALLVGSMLLFPVPAMATTDSTNSIHSLSFNNLEQEMRDNSPLILNMGDAAADGASKLSDGKDGLNDLKNGLIAALSKLGTTYTSGMTAKDIPVPSAPELTNTTDSLASDNQKIVNYATAQAIYIQVTSILNQISQIDSQISGIEDQQNDMWKSWIQVDQGKDQAIWGAQTLYLTYSNLNEQKDTLTTTLNLLQKKLTATQLKETLGMVTHVDVIAIESQIQDMNSTLDQVNKGIESIKGQLNVFLGQDFDTSLQLQDPSNVSLSQINAMDYEDDLKDALVQSFNVRLQSDEDSDKQDDAKRNFTLAFHNAYQDVLDKKKALDLEQYKLSNEKIKYDQAVLMNSLGLLANLDFEGASLVYNTQVNKVETAQQDLLKAYTAYDWMKKGLTISATSTASTSQSATGTSSSSGAAGSM